MPGALAAQVDAYVRSAGAVPAGESSQTQELIDVGLKLFELVRDRGNEPDLSDDEAQALHTLAAALVPVFELILRRAELEPGLRGTDALGDAWREFVPAVQFQYGRLRGDARPGQLLTPDEVRGGLRRRV
jgi:hypothetical protein